MRSVEALFILLLTLIITSELAAVVYSSCFGFGGRKTKIHPFSDWNHNFSVNGQQIRNHFPGFPIHHPLALTIPCFLLFAQMSLDLVAVPVLEAVVLAELAK